MDELQSLCYDSGCYLSDKDLQWAKIYLDRDGDGQITYNEFAQWWTASNNDRFKYLKLTDLQQKLVCKISELFRKYDKDNSGQLDNREKFEKLKQDLLKNQILKDIHELESRSFNEVDRSHDGKINFNELIAWFIDIGIIFGNDPTKTLEKIK
ncbi:unnamed protein product [Didymodactylos carnosus]|uniref:EF-hand domain-containing protein n=2 Tax=Didymodactylos carnosus TaxID=1234261 RepID=A0A814F3Q2_9BILA|nr:unnamed protein product [Didymodactylos carnosus]CAF3750381.1 unnamed protein product [Didymodactylos carnosus]